jgi:hypothetical protein
MLLIYPPAAKPCEPPAGIAHLAGALRGNGLPLGAGGLTAAWKPTFQVSATLHSIQTRTATSGQWQM